MGRSSTRRSVSLSRSSVDTHMLSVAHTATATQATLAMATVLLAMATLLATVLTVLVLATATHTDSKSAQATSCTSCDTKRLCSRLVGHEQIRVMSFTLNFIFVSVHM